ncbi:hypothetical protein ASPFODRAFT_74897 [Aspergillus luchuensis CBS 106.47]|uniref:Condensation domain-containing protein n=1 Tax=Aspergillus luchuensis (strain CBS 106.47) TaxID=1137211 RepID=A0A1M3T5F1_ASPLC|nr:hypothetical protein ASPFODRAFT_74897 [Aspergillus luchuensis CBS 106.47]
MSWQQISPGHYERPFDSMENFYRAVADAGAPLNKQHFLISCTLKLKSFPQVQNLQQAWKALRQRYPQIAVRANEDGSRLCYTVPSPEALDTWVQETFIIRNGVSADEIYSQEPPSSQFFLFCLPDTRELLFRTPHWRIDAYGLMYLQDTFLKILANGPRGHIIQLDGTEVRNLTPALDEAAGVPSIITPAISQAADEEISVLLHNQPTISIKTLPNALPATTRRLKSALPASTTRQIIKSCKSRGLTVTAAVHAALIVATLPYVMDPHHSKTSTTTTDGERKNYTTITPFDLRKYLPAPLNGPDAATSVYHTAIFMSIDLAVNKDFESIAAETRKAYGRDLSKDDPRNLFNFLPEYVNKALQLLSQQPDDPLRAPAHPDLSSLGIVNEYISTKYHGEEFTVEVEDWWLALESIVRLLLIHVWTWDDELVFSFNWNDAFYEEGFIKRFLSEWMEVLCESLGVSLE